MSLPFPGAIPPPAGQTANIVNPPNQTKSTIALHTICLTLSTTFVFLRFYTRKFITRELGFDDYCAYIAWALSVTFSALLIVSNNYGLGRHLWDVTFLNLEKAIKALTIAEFIYLAAAGLVKLSVLFFYRRVFAPVKPITYFIDGGIFFIFLTYTAFFFATIFECTPVRKSWDVLTPGHCYPSKILPYFSGALNVCTDLYVLILPVPALLGLQMDSHRRLRVMAIFGLGIFTCITSIIRLAKTPIIYSNIDRTWNTSKIGIWAVIEVNIGLMCSCMLALPAFLNRHWPKDFGGSIARFFYSFSHNSRKNESSVEHDPKNKTSQIPPAWSRGNRSEDANLDAVEYLKLHGPNDGIELNHVSSTTQGSSSVAEKSMV